MSSLEKTIDTKVINSEKCVEEKFVTMDEKINNLHSQRPEPVWMVTEVTGRMKTACFDGISSLSVFKFQFDTAASRNGWDEGEKALILTSELEVVAAEIL